MDRQAEAAPENRLLAYPWSSFGWYLAAPEHRPGWMRGDRLLGEHGIQGGSAAGRQEFERPMETRRLEEADEEALKPLRRGWCLGREEFRQQMLGLMEATLSRHTHGTRAKQVRILHFGRIRESLAERRHIGGLHRTNRASSLERSALTEDRRPERPLR